MKPRRGASLPAPDEHCRRQQQRTAQDDGHKLDNRSRSVQKGF